MESGRQPHNQEHPSPPAQLAGGHEDPVTLCMEGEGREEGEDMATKEQEENSAGKEAMQQ